MIAIGDRVEVNDKHGTVLYVGQLVGYNGDWVGIDWDDKSRGKHDGRINGVRYFNARHENSGSFVRTSSVKAGEDILTAMNCRYAEAVEEGMHILGQKRAELVNMEKAHNKQKDLWKLRVIALENSRVARPPTSKCAPFNYCSELNLCNNLLSRWSDLLNILDYFPSLIELNIKLIMLRQNYMESRMETVEMGKKVAAPISLIVLDDCRIDSETAQRVIQVFGQLTVLHLSNNNLKNLDPGDYGSNLQYINLDGNPINSLSAISALSALPRLKTLSISNCGISVIKIDDQNDYKSLQTLNIRDNHIEGLEWMSELSKLQSLQNLFYKCDSRCNGLEIREIIIAKIPQLLELERTPISQEERCSSELRFIAKFAPLADDGHRHDVDRLIKIHGQPVVSQNSFVGIGLLGLNLKYGSHVIKRSLPAATTIQRLIGILSRLFHLDATKIQIHAVFANNELSIDLDNPTHTLNYYSLSDGDIINVVPV